MKPLISVIIPVFNGEKYLAEAIESVLAQDGFHFDIIISDDGSTDHTSEIASRFGSSIRYFYRANNGPAAARNLGISVARGDYFAFLDADDLWTLQKIELQLNEFERNPDLDVVFGHIENFYSPDLTSAEKGLISIPVAVMPGYHVDTMLIKKDSFMHVGLFRNELRIGETIDWFARANEINLTSVLLPNVLARRRIHRTNLGILQRHQRSGYVNVLKAALDRRRAER